MNSRYCFYLDDTRLLSRWQGAARQLSSLGRRGLHAFLGAGGMMAAMMMTGGIPVAEGREPVGSWRGMARSEEVDAEARCRVASPVTGPCWRMSLAARPAHSTWGQNGGVAGGASGWFGGHGLVLVGVSGSIALTALALASSGASGSPGQAAAATGPAADKPPEPVAREVPPGGPGGMPPPPNNTLPPLVTSLRPGTPAPVMDLMGHQLRLAAGGALENPGYLHSGKLEIGDGNAFVNTGIVDRITLVSQGGSTTNRGEMRLEQGARLTGTLLNDTTGLIRLSGLGHVAYAENGSFINHGTIVADQTSRPEDSQAIFMDGRGDGDGQQINTGHLVASGGYGVMTSTISMRASSNYHENRRNIFINRGNIRFTADKGTRHALYVKAGHTGHDLLNDGTLTVLGNGAVAMRTDSESRLVNRGIINLGEEGSADSGQVAMMMGKDATSSAVILNDEKGEINVYSSNSYAFAILGDDFYHNRVLINRGKVSLLCNDKSCGTFGPGTKKQDKSDRYPSLVLPERLRAELKTTEPSRDALPADTGLPPLQASPAPTGALDLQGHVLDIQDGQARTQSGQLSNGVLNVATPLKFLNAGLASRMGVTVGGELRNAGALGVDRSSTVSGLLLNRERGTLHLSGTGSIDYRHNGSFFNYGLVTASAAAVDAGGRAPVIYRRHAASDSTGRGVNLGTLTAQGGYGVMESHGSMTTPTGKPDRRHVFVNRRNIEFTAAGNARRALNVMAGHQGHDLFNAGVITVHGDRAVAMYSDSDSHMINAGTINLGEKGSKARGQYAMVLGNQATPNALIVNEPKGVINVHSDDSHAFLVAPGRFAFLMNMGAVNLLCPSARCRTYTDSTTRAHDRSEFYPQRAYHADLAAEVNGTRGEIEDGDLSPDTRGAGQVPAPTRDYSNLPRTELPGGLWKIDSRGSVQAHDGAVESGRVEIVAGTLNNTGRMQLTSLTIDSDSNPVPAGFFNNHRQLSLSAYSPVDGTLTNEKRATLNLTDSASIGVYRNGSFVNHGLVMATRPAAGGEKAPAIYKDGWSFGKGVTLNTGKLVADGGYGVLATSSAMSTSGGPARNLFVNSDSGEILFTASNGTVNALHVKTQHDGHDLFNDGYIVLFGDKAVGMYSDADSQLVNRGTITLAGQGSGMVAMMLGPRASSLAAIINEGTIRIRARQSHAFHLQGGGKLINRGRVILECGDDGGCDTFKDQHTRQSDKSGTPEAAGLVFQPRIAKAIKDSARDSGASLQAWTNPLDHYQIGTSASSAGTLSGDYLALGHDVRIDTGFTAGTSARQQVYPKLVTGKGLSGAGNIRSTTVVWEARGYHDSDGDIGVTLVKNDYRDLIADASLAPVASALERSYGRGRLFSSLELPGREDFARALRQLSGAGFDRSLRAVPTLERRFGRMADSVTGDASGFGFRLLGRGEHGSRLGTSAYDMVALQQRFAPGTAQLAVRYGFARVSPGSKDREQGLDGSSQYLGARYARPLTTGLAVEGHLDYFLHQYRTRRTLDYGTGSKAVNYRARADHRRDQLGARLNLALAQPVGGAVLTPLLGVRLRYQRDGALRERDAGAFGLRVTSRHDVMLEALLGLRFSHDGRDSRLRGWQLDAAFHGRPAMLRQAGRREASLAGAPDARFALATEDGRRRFGYDGRLGLSHQGRHGRFSLEGYLSRDDGSLDRGVMANWRLPY